MEEFLETYGYWALLAGSFLEGETTILVASALLHEGLFEGLPLVLFAFLGSFASDWLYYLIGRANGRWWISRRPALQARFDPVQRFFLRHQVPMLLSYRFLYGFRILIPVVIGTSGVKPLRFLFFSTVTGLIWALTVSTVGYWVGRAMELTTAMLQANFVWIVLFFAAVGVTIGLTARYIFTRKLER